MRERTRSLDLAVAIIRLLRAPLRSATLLEFDSFCKEFRIFMSFMSWNDTKLLRVFCALDQKKKQGKTCSAIHLLLPFPSIHLPPLPLPLSLSLSLSLFPSFERISSMSPGVLSMCMMASLMTSMGSSATIAVNNFDRFFTMCTKSIYFKENKTKQKIREERREERKQEKRRWKRILSRVYHL